jgi:RNA polymerase sigma-B factor
VRTHSPPPASGSPRAACCRDGSDCSAAFAQYRETRDRALRNDLALRHEWLATRHARGLGDRGQPLDDLTQVAWIGLIKAIERYDPGRGVGFPAFATPTIVGELKRHFRDHSWDVTVPRRAKDTRTGVRAGTEVLQQRLRRAPTPGELADHLGVTREVVVETLAAMNAHRARSFDGGADHPASGPGVDARWTDRVDERVLAWAAIQRLDRRDRLILYWRFFDDATQAEIGERIGVSQVQVSRRLTASLAALRQALAAVRVATSG